MPTIACNLRPLVRWPFLWEGATMTMLTVKRLVEDLRELNDEYKYFWSCGIIKETVNLWRNTENYNLLDPISQMMAEHYIETL